MYLVPAGRIGFKCPAEIKPQTNSWRLLSPDHTLQVEVAEALRIDATWDGRMWDQDSRHVLVASDMLASGIERRRFRDRRYGSDVNYGAETHVLRDNFWIGQMTVSTSTLGSPFLSVPGGQIERWRPVVEALLASIAVRSPLAVPDALAELRVSLATDGLNPRFAGDRLILSLAQPQTPLEASGIGGSHISLEQLTQLPLGSQDELRKAKSEAFDIYRGLPGSRVISGAHTRGVLRSESRLTDGGDPVFASTLMAFGATRELKLTAFYGRADRARLLQALEQVLSSLALPDGQ